MVDSLRSLSAKCAASSSNLTKADLLRLPLDVHDDLRLHLSKEKQIELWNGEYKRWHYNGQLWEHSWHKNGVRDGEFKLWYSDGQLWEHSWHKNGVRDGEYKSWWSNGQLQIHCWHKNNKNEGEYKRWRISSQLWRHCWYRGGIVIKEIL